MKTGISSFDGRTVTFTLSMPAGALFAETLKALREAKAAQLKIGNIEAAKTIYTLLVLAEGGASLFEKSAANPFIPKQS